RRGAGGAGPDPDRAQPRSAAALSGPHRRRHPGGGRRPLRADPQERWRLRRAAQSTQLTKMFSIVDRGRFRSYSTGKCEYDVGRAVMYEFAEFFFAHFSIRLERGHIVGIV